MKNTKSIVISALLVALSLALFSVELLLPPFPFCPAAKIGLANIVTLFMLTNNSIFNTRYSVLVLISRCVLSALITGRIMSVLFSLTWGLSAIFVMIIIRNILGKDKVVSISISGAVSHNLAQIITAVLIYGTYSAFYYIPSLFIAGVSCGVLTGLCVKTINKINFLKR